jgi:effector-binding domain-containing protein
MRSDLFSIGEFSMVSRMSVKTLRFYDDRGLLKPGHVDSMSGYRYYSSAQLPEANLIRLLRSLELPLEEIRVFLRERDPEQRKTLLEQHRRAMEERVEEYRSIVSSIERVLAGKTDDMERKVDIKELASQNILGIRYHTDYEHLSESIGRAYTDLFTHLGELGEYPGGPPMTLYYGEEFDESDIDMEACVPVNRVLPGKGEVKWRELPGGLMVSTLHIGPYHEVAGAYQALDLWAKENGYNYAGPAREVYLVNPDMVDDEADLRTEIIFPISEQDPPR